MTALATPCPRTFESTDPPAEVADRYLVEFGRTRKPAPLRPRSKQADHRKGRFLFRFRDSAGNSYAMRRDTWQDRYTVEPMPLVRQEQES